MRTSELIGPALDWAVAKCEGLKLKQFCKRGSWYYAEPDGTFRFIVGHTYSPSTNWAQGGPIIDCEDISVGRTRNKKGYAAWIGFASDFGMAKFFIGPTPLIAAMRCYVTSVLGEEVDVPEELK